MWPGFGGGASPEKSLVNTPDDLSSEPEMLISFGYLWPGPVLVDIFPEGVTMSIMARNGGCRARRVFGEEYRAGAVRPVLEEGKSAGAVARDLDLTESPLRAWVARARASTLRLRRPCSCRRFEGSVAPCRCS